MKRISGVVGAIVLWCGLCAFPAQAALPEVLSQFDFHIVGLGLKAAPEYQAVPKGIATQVTTGFDAGDLDVAAIVAQLPQDYTVRAELSGPAFATPLTLVTRPGSPFDLPSLAINGRYTLANIRLVDGNGTTLFGAVPQAVAIESIPDPLITSVTTRPLTAQELEERGVTFDSSNFTAYQFTAGIATASGQVPLNLPVVIPNSHPVQQSPELVAPSTINIPVPETVVLPPEVPETVLPRNLEVKPFLMEVDDQEAVSQYTLPPIPGIVVIPGNIGFLHQYFSALVLVSNGAPLPSGLSIRDVRTTIHFPVGEDLVAGSDATPGDDPLRMAKGSSGYFPRNTTVLNAGTDGKPGTADDSGTLQPGESGQADFTIEGLKEGAHKVDFDIIATLDGLPIGPVTLKGKASGAVLVRNPDFAITLGHPATVRAGEMYDLFITVSNTGQSLANLVTIGLDPRAISGAAFADGETDTKSIESILPGSAAMVKFRLKSQRTGKVTATAFESSDVKGRFILRTGVGENNIPLSPDSLILPYTGELTPDLVSAAIGLLGQAWSVATAPAGALPATVLPIRKPTVTSRAYDLSEAGLRVLIGDSLVKAVEDLAFDFIGSDVYNKGFDALRRSSSMGLDLNRALAAIFAGEIDAVGSRQFQADLADKVSYRPGHLSIVSSAAPLRLQLSDAAGNRSGALDATPGKREIPYAESFAIGENGESRAHLLLATRLDASSYTLELAADADSTFDLGIVLPDSSGELRQYLFSALSLPAGGRGRIVLTPGSDLLSLSIDDNGDGSSDRTLAPATVTLIADHPPRIVAATQLVPAFGPGGDKHGRNVALLFSERVTKTSAEKIGNYGVNGNLVKQATLQPGSRMAFLLLREGIGPFFDHTLTAQGLIDTAGLTMVTPETLPVTITATGPAAVVSGTVRTARGEPVAGAVVRLYQLIWYTDPLTGIEESRYALFTEKSAGSDGSYRFEYVLQNGDPAGPFQIEVVNPASGEVGSLTTGVIFHGQQLTLDIFMKAKGSLSGTVRNEAGNPVGGATVQVITLADHRGQTRSSDASGAFSFSGLMVGAYQLTAIHSASLSQGSTMGTLPEDGSAVTQDLTVRQVAGIAQGTVSGKVLGPDGVTPQAGVVVIVKAPYSYQNWQRSATDGSFSFAGVYAGEVSVKARDDVSGEESQVGGTLGNGATLALNVIMGGTGSVNGTVSRDDGKAPEGLYVIVTPISGQKRLVMTDSRGTFSCAGLPVGNTKISILDPNDFNRTVASGTVTILNAGDVAAIALFVPFKALATGTITGILHHRDGSVWANAPLHQVLNSHQYYTRSVDAAGRFSIANLPLGSYTFTVVKGNEVINASTDLWYDTQIRTLDLYPVGLGTVTGNTWDNADKVPTGADVTFVSMKPNLVGLLSYDPMNATVVKSDPQTGRFSFSNVFMGSFNVSSSNIFRPTPVKAGGSITTHGQTVNVELFLKGSPAKPGDPPPVNQPGSVSGQVLMPDGSPAGADIRVTITMGADVTVTTDAQGHFQFEPLITAGNHPIYAEDPATTLKWKGNVTVPSGLDVPVTVKLLGRGSISVKVVNAAGVPVAGAGITLKGTDYPNDTAAGDSDSSGQALFANLTQGSYAVAATGTGSLSGLSGRNQVLIPGNNAAVTVEVRLAPSATVSGRFLKADGITPIAGGQITLKRNGQAIAYASSSSAPADLGRFRLEYIPLGDFSVEGYDPVTERRGSGGGRLATDGGTVNADVVVTPRGTVKGIVLNYGRTYPVAAAPVTISFNGGSYSSVSAPDGTFLFAGIAAGGFTLNAKDPVNGLSGQTSGTLSYENEMVATEVRIAPTGSIAGTVYLPDRSTPVLTATVRLNGGTPVPVDPESGAFRYDNLATGRSYTLTTAQPTTRRTGSTVATISRDLEVANGDIILGGVGSVSGIVYEADGTTPLYGAKVELHFGGSTLYASTEADGSFNFTDIPTGAVTVSASHTERNTGAAKSGTLQNEGQTVNFNLILGPVAAVKARVLLADGVTPARGGGIRLETGNSQVRTGITDSNGEYLFASIPTPCTFSLYVEDAAGVGQGRAFGTLSANGQILDLGTLILDDKAIFVTGINPAAGSVNVPVDQQIRVLFSEPADPATLNSANLYLMQGGSKVAGTLQADNDNSGVTFTPAAPLNGFALYTFVVNGNVRDRVWRTLAQPQSASFTTIDNIAPTIMARSPQSGGNEVAVDAVIRITFSEPLNPDTLTSVKLLNGATVVATRTDLLQGGTVIALTPLAPLAANGLYTVAIAGVQDLVGNSIAAPQSSAFATIDTRVPTLTALTVPPGSDLIKGNTLPITAQTPDTDVALVDFFVDDVRVKSISSAPFTMAYTLPRVGVVHLKAIAQDKAGNRGLPVFLDLTAVADAPPTVAILAPLAGSSVNTGATVNIVVEAMDDLLAKEITLSVGGEQTTTRTVSAGSGKSYKVTFALTIPSNITQGGRIVLTATAKDSAGTMSPAVQRTLIVHDSLPPVAVSAVSPGQTTLYRPGESGLATFTFSDNVGITAINCVASGAATGSQNFSFEPPQSQVSRDLPFLINADAGPYAAVSVTCVAADVAGNQAEKKLTLQAADIVPPKVTGTNFADKIWGVATDVTLSVSFDEALASATVNGSSVKLAPEAGEAISGTVALSADQKVLTFKSAAPLADDSHYALTIGAAVADVAGNPFGAEQTFSFVTLPANTAVIQGQGTASAPFILAGGSYRTVFIFASYVQLNGPIVTSSFILENGSVVTHKQTGSPETARVDITADEVSIDATSKIDVSGKGYAGGYGQGNGRTLGNTTQGGSAWRNGGSYGGLGGVYSGSVNAAYGDPTDPNEYGSGGGGYYYSGWGYYNYSGGSGGGLIRLNAATLQLDGEILANGTAGSSSVGGGSGGGIRIDIGTLNGNGKISVQGGGSSDGGAGSGGRIAVNFRSSTLPESNINASGGQQSTTNYQKNGGAGTIYLKHVDENKGRLIVDNHGIRTTRNTIVTDLDLKGFEISGNANLDLSGTVTTESPLVFSNTISNFRINSGAVLPENFTLSGSQVSLSGSLVMSGALKLQNNSALTGSRVEVTAQTIHLDAASKIDATGRGYSGGYGTGSGLTLGNTATGGSAWRNGGSYGGLGGYYSGAVNMVYGDPTNPNEYGSGGGGSYYSGWSYYNYSGGSGGGLIRLNAATLQLDGEILANGTAGYSSAGGGSGGGIRIDIGTLNGNGKISAQGGGSSDGGAGSGGRIAIYYDILTLSNNKILASGGKAGSGGTAARNGGAGTVFLKNNANTKADLIINNNGITTTRVTPIPGGDYRIYDVIGGAVASPSGPITSENEIVITDSQMTISGDYVVPRNLTLQNSTLVVAGGVTVPGKFQLTSSTLSVGNSLKVTGTITAQTGSILTQAADTDSAWSRLEIAAGSIITIDASSRIDVTGKGYLGGLQGENNSEVGRTTGNLTAGGSAAYNGASHGGLGGKSIGHVNAAYGSFVDPAEPGSGGGGDRVSANPGGNGGGCVKVIAPSLTLNGGIIANGMDSLAGAGSGGSVRIDVATLSGNGSILARGGNGGTTGGGGGRIAIFATTNSLPGANRIASGGKGGDGTTPAHNGGAGTVFLKLAGRTYGDLTIDNNGLDPAEESTPFHAAGTGVITVMTGSSLIQGKTSWTPGALKGSWINPNIIQTSFFGITDNTTDTLFINPTTGNLNTVAVVGDTFSGAYALNSLSLFGKARVYSDEQFHVAGDALIDDATLVAAGLYSVRTLLTNGGIFSRPPPAP